MPRLVAGFSLRGRMAGMGEKRQKFAWLSPLAIALALLALLSLPVALIGCAVLENALFRTNYLEQVAQVTGTHDAFGRLYAALKPILGW
jgi:hypothetical protein